MARATRRRRRISFNKDVICCGELVMVVDKKVVHSFKMCDHIKVMCVSGRQHCGWQGQHAEETMDSGHYDVSLKLELLVFYSSLLASSSSFFNLMMASFSSLYNFMMS